MPDGPLVIAPTTVAVALLVGVVVTVLAAWLPARRAAKIPPVAAMSSVHAARRPTKSLVVRNTIGALVTRRRCGRWSLLATGTDDDGNAPMSVGRRAAG